MLKRRDRIERLEEAIVDTEIAITSQVLGILAAEAGDRDTSAAHRLLRTLYGILVEYRRARDLMVEARELMDWPPLP